MNILLIEDELPAREKLRRLAEGYRADVQIMGEAGSVREAVRILAEDSPDVILSDIQLSDGVAFEIFERCEVNAPVIFTTAFNEYLMEAFAHNGIEYLLKPIQREKLYQAFDKYAKLQEHFRQHSHTQQASLHALSEQLRLNTPDAQRTIAYKERIIVQKGREYTSLNVGEIAYCYTEHRIVSIITHRNERYFTDRNVGDLENELNPKLFFRLNRKYLCHIQAIQSFKPETKGKIIVELYPKPDEIVLVSQERASLFRAWLER
jgi:two-component system LytT family response regulator